MKQGDRVYLTKQMARWYLDNPDIWFSPNCLTCETTDAEYDITIQFSLAALMGVRIVGYIVERTNGGPNYYAIRFDTPYGPRTAIYELGRDIKPL